MRFFYKVCEIESIRRLSYRQDINTLRAVAVLAVVFYHAEFQHFKGGWLGVDVFFVISGFLISNIIISELNNNSFSFKNFYIRRVRRIIPGLFSTLLLTLPLSYWLLTPRAMLEFTKSISSSILFYSNYYFQNLDFYNAEPTKLMPLLHTWSLAVEEQFYVIFPLICFIIYKISRKYFFIILFFLFVFSLFLNSTISEITKFYQIQYRAWELLAGFIAMVINQKFIIKRSNYIGYILVFFSILFFEDSTQVINSVEPKIVAIVGSMLILISNNPNKVNKFFENRLVSLIGLSSFSIYLFHQPIFAFYRVFEKRYLSNSFEYSAYVLFVIVILLSYLNWRFVEILFQKMKIDSFAKIIFGCLLLFFLFIFVSLNTNGLENRYESISDDVFFYSNNNNIYPSTFDNVNYLYTNKSCEINIGSSNFCSWSKQSTDKTIYLIGDSLTNSLSVSFLEKLDTGEQNYNLIFIRGTGGRCILSQQSDTSGYVYECQDEFFDQFIMNLDKNHDIVIAFGSFHIWLSDIGKEQIKCNSCDYVQVFKNRLLKIGENSSNFIIVQPTPVYNYPIADLYLYKKVKWPQPITLDLDEWKLTVSNFDNFMQNVSKKNIKVLKTIPLFCNEDIESFCYASKDNVLLYSDENHLTLNGANLITFEINQLLRTLSQ